MKRRHLSVAQAVNHIIIMLLLLLLLYPLAMALWGSFKTQAEFEVSKWYPTLPLNFTNIGYALPKLARFIFNTVFVGAAGTLGMLVVSTLAAYSFAKIDFPGKSFFYSLVLGLMMVPAIMTLVPSFMLYKALVGVNTYTILILPIIVGGSVFGVFLLRTFFEGVPDSVLEAARIDGANELSIYLQICVPLSGAIIATLAIMQINGVWNDYIWPMISIPTETAKLTISAAIKKEFLSGNAGSYPTLFAGYLVSSAPIILLFIFTNKHYVEGLTTAGIKF